MTTRLEGLFMLGVLALGGFVFLSILAGARRAAVQRAESRRREAEPARTVAGKQVPAVHTADPV